MSNDYIYRVLLQGGGFRQPMSFPCGGRIFNNANIFYQNNIYQRSKYIFCKIHASSVKWPWLSLQWRHNGRYGVSNHQHHDWLFNRLFSRLKKHKSFASLAFVMGIHRWPVNSLHKEPVTRKMFPFDDVIMYNDNLKGVFLFSNFVA